MIIGLGHYARAGKDSLAAALVERHGFVRLGFADAVRDLAYRTMPNVAVLVDLKGWEAAKVLYPAQVRRPLVDLGAACRQILGPHAWIDALARKIDPAVDYVITDVRYPNEVAFIVEERGGVAVKVTRPGVAPGHDMADQALADFGGWDWIVTNDGDLGDLDHKADELVRNIRVSKGLNAYFPNL